MKNDLISRKDAINAVEESRRLNHHKNGKEACAHEYEHRHFLKLLMDLPPAQPEPPWILVSERLPENDCKCIVTAKVKHVDNYADYEIDTADFADGIFTTDNVWWGVESIVAWMPLPEPWRG